MVVKNTELDTVSGAKDSRFQSDPICLGAIDQRELRLIHRHLKCLVMKLSPAPLF